MYTHAFSTKVTIDRPLSIKGIKGELNDVDCIAFLSHQVCAIRKELRSNSVSTRCYRYLTLPLLMLSLVRFEVRVEDS